MLLLSCRLQYTIQYSIQYTRIIGLYRPPVTGANEISCSYDIIRLLKKLCSTEKCVLLLGDLNLPAMDWSLYHAPDNVVHNNFLSFIDSYCFYQHVNAPTRNNNILDLVLSTDRKLICELELLPAIGNSDHNVIKFSTVNESVTVSTEVEQPVYDWKRANFTAISYELCLINWDLLFHYCFNVQD